MLSAQRSSIASWDDLCMPKNISSTVFFNIFNVFNIPELEPLMQFSPFFFSCRGPIRRYPHGDIIAFRMSYWPVTIWDSYTRNTRPSRKKASLSVHNPFSLKPSNFEKPPCPNLQHQVQVYSRFETSIELLTAMRKQSTWRSSDMQNPVLRFIFMVRVLIRD